jgi:hypothetical protein
MPENVENETLYLYFYGNFIFSPVIFVAKPEKIRYK